MTKFQLTIFWIAIMFLGMLFGNMLAHIAQGLPEISSVK